MLKIVGSIVVVILVVNLIKFHGRTISGHIDKKLNVDNPDKKRCKRYLDYYKNYIDINGYKNNNNYNDLSNAFYNKFESSALKEIQAKKTEFKARIESHVYVDFGTYTAIICSIFFAAIVAIFSAGKMDIKEFGIYVVICLGIIFFGEVYRKYLSNDYGNKRSFFIICYDILEELEQKQIKIKRERKGKSLRKYKNKR